VVTTRMEGAHPVRAVNMEAESPIFLASAVSMTAEYCKWRPVHIFGLSG
jgi:hypothetical protein